MIALFYIYNTTKYVNLSDCSNSVFNGFSLNQYLIQSFMIVGLRLDFLQLWPRSHVSWPCRLELKFALINLIIIKLVCACSLEFCWNVKFSRPAYNTHPDLSILRHVFCSRKDKSYHNDHSYKWRMCLSLRLLESTLFATTSYRWQASSLT